VKIYELPGSLTGGAKPDSRGSAAIAYCNPADTLAKFTIIKDFIAGNSS
jgi:hypothetical protein